MHGTSNRERPTRALHCGRGIAAALLCSLIVIDGGTPASAAESAESASIQEIQSIALPPVILPGGVYNAEVTRAAFDQMTLSLALKGYVMHLVEGLALDSSVDPSELRSADPAALAALLPEGGEHYLLCWIDYPPVGAGGSGPGADSVRASAVLIERRSKRILWQNFAFHTASDPLQEQMAAFFGALMLEWMSPQPAFYTPIQRQIEFERRVDQLEESNRMLGALASPVAIATRALLTTFPEKPMR